MKICNIDGCETLAPKNRKDMCEKHYKRLRRHGDTSVVNKRGQAPGETHPRWIGDSASFSAVHSRLGRTRGKAARHTCIVCPRPAHDWAYQYGCPNEKPSPEGPYSTDLSRYAPMCRSCHIKFDKEAGLVSA